MRQNMKDMRHTLVSSKGASRLKYGLDINIELGDFDIESIDLEKDLITVDISKPDGVKIRKERQAPPMEEVENTFERFHKRKVRNAWLIDVKPNTKLKQPIIIRSKTGSENSLLSIYVNIGENSYAQIIDLLGGGTEKKGYNSKHIELNAGKNSKVKYYHIQKLSQKTIHYSRKTARADEKAVVGWYDINLGSSVALSNTKTILQGESSGTNIDTVFFSEKNQQFDLSGEGIHKARNTFSALNSKGTVKDVSKTLYRSNIHITENANGSNGNQKADIMLIDPESEGDAIPQLLIDNNDVKCSHAVAVGSMDEEKLFYLMSRGLSRKEAKHEIIKGFFYPFIEGMESNIIREEIIKSVEERMSR